MAKSTIQGLTVTIGADTKQFTTAINQISAEARNIAKDLKTVNDSLKLDPKNAQKTADSFRLLQEQAQKASEKVKLIQSGIDKLNKEYEDGKISADDYKTSMERLSILLSQAKNEQDLINEEIKQFGQEAGTAGKSALTLGDIIKGNLISDVIMSGLSALANLAKSIASHLWNGVKELASATWQFTKDSVSIAEESRQTLAKVGQVFGESKQHILDWSKSAVTALGLSSSEAQAAAATFGNMFAALDVGIVKTEKIDTNFAVMSTDLVQLAADVAAFNNVTTADVLNAFQSGLAGTSRQLREYGIVITAALVEQKALDLGLKETSDDLTEGDKIIARYALMMEQAAHQTGQFARESDSATVQSQVLQAYIKELQKEIGEKLIPVQARFYKEINDFLASDAGKKLFEGITEAVGNLADKMIELINDGRLEEWIEKIKEKVPEIVEKIKEWSEKLDDLLPKIASLVEKLLALFGIETDEQKFARETHEAFTKVKNSIEDLAKSFDISTESMEKAIIQFAEENGKDVKEIYDNWNEYEPKIAGYLNSMKSSYNEQLIDGAYSIISDFANGNQEILSDIYNNWGVWEPKIIEYANSLGTDYGTKFEETLGFIQNFANQNNVSLGEIFSNWSYWEPQIKTSMDTLSTNAQNTQEAYDEQMKKLPQSTQDALTQTQQKINGANSIDLTPLKSLAQRVGEIVSNIVNGVDYAGNAINSGPWEEVKNKGGWTNMFNNTGYDFYTGGMRASGGPVMAGHVYRVNDDAGHRPEWFIPSQNGYILNGNQTDRIVNNNNSRSVGNVNIYVQSYGMNVAEVADELGAAFQNKLRMSGAML